MSEAAAETIKPTLELRMLVLATAVVLAALLALRFLNRVSVFPPTIKDASLAPSLVASTPHVREVRFAAEDGLQLYGWVQGRDEAPVKIIQTMGNAEYVGPSAGTYAETAAFLDAQFLLFDYRGFANSPGRPTEVGIYSDVRGAYRFAVNELKWRPAQIVLWGRSLGGAPATRLAADLLAETRRASLAGGGPPRALLLEAAFTSIADMAHVQMGFLGRPDWLTYSLMDNLGRAPGLTVPTLVYHGTRDEIIPFEQGQTLFAALPGPRRFLQLDGAGHNNLWSNPETAGQIRQAIKAWLAEHPEKG